MIEPLIPFFASMVTSYENILFHCSITSYTRLALGNFLFGRDLEREDDDKEKFSIGLQSPHLTL